MRVKENNLHEFCRQRHKSQTGYSWLFNFLPKNMHVEDSFLAARDKHEEDTKREAVFFQSLIYWGTAHQDQQLLSCLPQHKHQVVLSTHKGKLVFLSGILFILTCYFILCCTYLIATTKTPCNNLAACSKIYSKSYYSRKRCLQNGNIEKDNECIWNIYWSIFW